MRSLIKLLLVGTIAINMVGCATITTDANQMIQVTATDQANNVVDNANCILKNTRGEWNVKTQGTTQVHKSADNLMVKCSKEGVDDGQGTLISRANAGMWGNILIGGGIGAIIDHNKGTAYTYPTWINIIMGNNLVYDRKEQNDENMLLGKRLTDEDLNNITNEKAELEKAELEKSVKETAS
jgi:hypothetical protein